LATRRADRSVAVLVWNLADVVQPSGIPDAAHTRAVSGNIKRFQVELRGVRPGHRVNIRFVDQERGSNSMRRVSSHSTSRRKA
jgi:xylan 1,4-beta-xylosidase